MRKSHVAATVSATKLSVANNQFGASLLKKTALKNHGTLCFSPISLFTALLGTALGSKGDTQSEILSAIHMDKNWDNEGEIVDDFYLIESSLGKKKDQVKVTKSNRAFVGSDYPLNHTFQTFALERGLNTSVESVDFQGNPDGVRGRINDLVKTDTNGMITNLLSKPLPRETSLILLNVIHFLGKWKNKFNSLMTKDVPFSNGSIVRMMTNRGNHFKDIPFSQRDNKYTVFDLPYGDESVVFRVILPTRGNQLSDILDVDKILSMDLHSEANLTLTMPVFKVDTNLPAKNVLYDMGVKLAFTDAADFSPMSANDVQDLKIADVVHRAVIDVNESGTEASAATAVVMMRKCMPTSLDITLDRPFIFAIIDKTYHTALFLGQYNG